MAASREITRLLKQLAEGHREAEAPLVGLVYRDLRKIAARFMQGERRGHTLQTTALAHEAYLRLINQREANWHNRAHFFGVAAGLMRRILVDHARRVHAGKRGGQRVNLDEVPLVSEARSEQLLALDEALNKLAQLDARQSRVVEMRFFAGLGEEEIAEALGVGVRTVKRDWQFAKAWLYGELGGAGDVPRPMATNQDAV
jgi:RNA polymerase sigma-70 factor, ECF subfamily